MPSNIDIQTNASRATFSTSSSSSHSNESSSSTYSANVSDTKVTKLDDQDFDIYTFEGGQFQHIGSADLKNTKEEVDSFSSNDFSKMKKLEIPGASPTMPSFGIRSSSIFKQTEVYSNFVNSKEEADDQATCQNHEIFKFNDDNYIYDELEANDYFNSLTEENGERMYDDDDEDDDNNDANSVYSRQSNFDTYSESSSTQSKVSSRKQRSSDEELKCQAYSKSFEEITRDCNCSCSCCGNLTCNEVLTLQ